MDTAMRRFEPGLVDARELAMVPSRTAPLHKLKRYALCGLGLTIAPTSRGNSSTGGSPRGVA